MCMCVYALGMWVRVRAHVHLHQVRMPCLHTAATVPSWNAC